MGKETPSLNGISDFDGKVGGNSQGGKGKVTCQKKGHGLRNPVQFSIHCLALRVCQQYGQPWKDGAEQDMFLSLGKISGGPLGQGQSQTGRWKPGTNLRFRQVSYLAELWIRGSIVDAVG